MENYDNWKTDNKEVINDFASDIYLWINDKLIEEYCKLEKDKTAHISLLYSLARSLGLASLEQDDIDVYNSLKNTVVMEQAYEIMRQKIIEEKLSA